MIEGRSQREDQPACLLCLCPLCWNWSQKNINAKENENKNWNDGKNPTDTSTKTIAETKQEVVKEYNEKAENGEVTIIEAPAPKKELEEI